MRKNGKHLVQLCLFGDNMMGEMVRPPENPIVSYPFDNKLTVQMRKELRDAGYNPPPYPAPDEYFTSK